MEAYRVPKTKVQATLGLAGREARQVSIFLAHQAERHAGPERPSDLLEGEATFFACVDAEDGFVLIQREAVAFLKVATEVELGSDHLPAEDLGASSAQAVPVTVMLEDDRPLEGTVVFLLPDAQQRLQDYLNVSGTFFPLRAGEEIYLVNKRRILWIRKKEG
ncbi:MAG: hypothetical protein P1V51_03860 [Deltaproteobacteria bacterium]|nr:hypothetical protein [Deltaproteobacteria bacterium]